MTLGLSLARARNALTTVPKAIASASVGPAPCNPSSCLRGCKCFASVHYPDKLFKDVWFTSTVPRGRSELGGQDKQPPDERTLQLGKTIRVLHERLPNLLQTPLPSEILSPQISLHLFPSTHPHLPTVSGRIAYLAALWTAPVAWGRVPVVGNVKLTILSERMVRNGGTTGVAHNCRDEKLIVKWKTCGKSKDPGDTSGGLYRGVGIAPRDPVERIKSFIAGTTEGASKEDAGEFCGLFVFEFDEEGRIKKHIIEHTEEGGQWERMTRVVSVTDWLMGRIKGRSEETPALAWCEERPSGAGIRIVDRRRRMT